MIDYTLLRSKRRTLVVEMHPDGTVLVRAPQRMSIKRIEAFLTEREEEIRQKTKRAAARIMPRDPGEYYLFGERRQMDSDVGREWLQRHYREALAPVLAEMVPEVAEQFGFRYRGIKITAAEKRFGSCSGDNRLCFSYRLAAYPMECIHYVVCHELCHTVEKNHGPRFWALLEHICPESKALRHEMEKVYL